MPATTWKDGLRDWYSKLFLPFFSNIFAVGIDRFAR